MIRFKIFYFHSPKNSALQLNVQTWSLQEGNTIYIIIANVMNYINTNFALIYDFSAGNKWTISC